MANKLSPLTTQMIPDILKSGDINDLTSLASLMQDMIIISREISPYITELTERQYRLLIIICNRVMPSNQSDL
jgi:hypothetical protein